MALEQGRENHAILPLELFLHILEFVAQIELKMSYEDIEYYGRKTLNNF
jgi:hypothetical protein